MATSQTVEQKTLVNYRVEDGIAVLEMSDPPANTYTYEMMQQLDACILAARMDDSVHVIVLRGAGEKFFSAGASIPMINRVDPQFKYYFCLHANETLSRLEQTPKLVIAALNGHTVGGGLEIAMACDIRIAKKEAGKIGLPEVTLGVRSRHRRHPTSGPSDWQGEGDRDDVHRADFLVRGSARLRHH